jgi:uncharacterized protein YecT (DUF1311 family)
MGLRIRTAVVLGTVVGLGLTALVGSFGWLERRPAAETGAAHCRWVVREAVRYITEANTDQDAGTRADAVRDQFAQAPEGNLIQAMWPLARSVKARHGRDASAAWLMSTTNELCPTRELAERVDAKRRACGNSPTPSAQSGCFTRLRDMRDQEIGGILRTLSELSRSDGEQEELVDTQAAWLAYRDERCRSAGAVYTTGLLQVEATAICEVDMARRRAEELREDRRFERTRPL